MHTRLLEMLVEDGTLEPERLEGCKLFSDNISLEEGYAHLTKEWTIIESYRFLKDICLKNQLLIRQINNFA